MKISVWSSYYYDLSPEDMVLEFKAHGFNATELSDEHSHITASRQITIRLCTLAHRSASRADSILYILFDEIPTDSGGSLLKNLDSPFETSVFCGYGGITEGSFSLPKINDNRRFIDRFFHFSILSPPLN